MKGSQETVDHKVSDISTQPLTADFVETKMLSSEDSAQRCFVLGCRETRKRANDSWRP
jgi:hypothetical protein